jgi:hypothetical protein
MSAISPIEEQRLRNLIQRSFFLMEEAEKKQQIDETRFRKIVRHLILEAEGKGEPIATTTGGEFLAMVLDRIWSDSKTSYMRLKTSPQQRKDFLHTWEWLFKETFYADVKKRNAVEKAVDQIEKDGFSAEEPEATEEIETAETVEELNEIFLSLFEEEEKEKTVMKITDPDLIHEPEPSDEDVEASEEEDFVNKLATAPLGKGDTIAQGEAVRIFKQTSGIVFKTFDQLDGSDAEQFYKWFFINMLGTKNSGFEEDSPKKVIGHFQEAELELKGLDVETSPDLLPEEDPESFNLDTQDF